MPISRGQMPRQLYGLGSFVKSIGKGIKKAVKGVTRTVKDNPLLAVAALNFAPMLAGKAPFIGMGSLTGSKATLGLPSFLSNVIPESFGGKAALGIAGASALGGMFTAKQQEELEELRESGDPEKLKNYLRRYYSNLNLNASPEEVESFVRANVAEGGRMQYAMGSPEENAMQASGIMGLPLNENPAGVTELDLRETGGFIPPVGVKEKADDIPAMLSNNEFVFTADAVRGMGDGNVNLGAQRMYDMMKKLENGGRV